MRIILMLTCHKIANFKLLLILSTFYFEDVKTLNFPQANTILLQEVLHWDCLILMDKSDDMGINSVRLPNLTHPRSDPPKPLALCEKFSDLLINSKHNNEWQRKLEIKRKWEWPNVFPIMISRTPRKYIDPWWEFPVWRPFSINQKELSLLRCV